MNDSRHGDVIAALGEAADHAGEPRADLIERARRIGASRRRRRRLAVLVIGLPMVAVVVGVWQWIPRGVDGLDPVQPQAPGSSASGEPRRCGPVPRPARGEQRRFEVSATFPGAARGGALLRVDVGLKTLYGPSAVARTSKGGHVILVRQGAAVTEPITTTEPWIIELVPGQSLNFSTGASLVQCRDPGKSFSTSKDIRPLPPGRYDVYVVMGFDFLDGAGRPTGHSSAVGGPWPLTIT